MRRAIKFAKRLEDTIKPCTFQVLGPMTMVQLDLMQPMFWFRMAPTRILLPTASWYRCHGLLTKMVIVLLATIFPHRIQFRSWLCNRWQATYIKSNRNRCRQICSRNQKVRNCNLFFGFDVNNFFIKNVCRASRTRREWKGINRDARFHISF